MMGMLLSFGPNIWSKSAPYLSTMKGGTLDRAALRKAVLGYSDGVGFSVEGGKLVCERRAESKEQRAESGELNLRHELRGEMHL